MRLVASSVLFIIVLLAFWELAASPSHPETSAAIYDSNPSHIWNRLYIALLTREDRHRNRVGEDSLDPPLWRETEHLLSEPSHQLATQVLDEFLRTHGEGSAARPRETSCVAA